MIAEKDLCPCCRCRPIAPERSVCDRCAGGDSIKLMQKMDAQINMLKEEREASRWECPDCGFTMHASHAESPVSMPDQADCLSCQNDGLQEELRIWRDAGDSACQSAELEQTADKLSDAWLLLDDVAQSGRDSDQTRQAAAAILMAQQAPGWKDKLCANALWNADLPSPRTCEMCGIGACKLGIKRKGWHK